MAYKVTVPFHTITLQLSEHAYVILPVSDPKTVRLDGAIGHVAAEFQKSFQENVLDKGKFRESISLDFNNDAYKHSTVAFTFTLNKQAYLRAKPTLTFNFNYFYKITEKGVWAFVPAIGTEVFSNTQEELENTLQQAIRLEFSRKKRMLSVQRLLTAIWYTDAKLEDTTIQLSYHTPSELEKIQEEKKQELLPLVGQKLQFRTQQTFGREQELDSLVRAMKGKFGKNILLVGPSGVGKTALVQELVRRKKDLGIKQEIYETTASILIKEMTRDTGWQDNLAYLCQELSRNNHLLFVRNLLELFEVGQYSGSNVSMADYLRSYISRGEIGVISECTEEEFAQIEVRSPNYTSFFQIIRLQEPKDNIEEIIIKKIESLATTNKASISKDAIEETIRLNRRYTPYSGFPGKPIRFLESIILNNKSKKDRKKIHIDRSEVITYFCEDTGMPAFMVDPAIPMKPNEILGYFHNNIYGQDKAVKEVVNLMASVKTALTRQGKPIASMLFVGPTGVGKTEMAKVLANFMFGSRNKMIRFDMSEFSNPYAVTRLIGASYKEDGLLTSAIRREPFSVILFDEIEKASPNFYDLLLQILGEGRLTDSRGKVVNFCSTIIIMTSNIGAKKLQSNTISWSKDLDVELVIDHFMSAVRKHFRPELFNRIDQIIPFEPLTKEVIKIIVHREVDIFKKREGIKYRKMDFFLTDEVYSFLGEVGYNPKYGARHLQRAIREHLIIPLANKLNAYDYDEQLIVNIVLEENKVALHIETDPLKLDLLMEELTRNEFADYSSSLRRGIGALQEGSFYVQLLSRLDMYESQKKKLKEKFWEDKRRSEDYSYCLTTKENVEAMANIISDYEEELALVILDLKKYNPNIIDDIKQWEADYYNLKLELFMRISPQANTSYLAIYGREPSRLAEIYIRIFEEKDYYYSYNTIWYNEDYYNEEVIVSKGEGADKTFSRKPRYQYVYVENSYTPKNGDDLLVGVVFVIKGDCPAIYFKEETGFQKIKITQKESYKYLVDASDKPIHPPHGLNRRNFFEKSKERRIYSETRIKDKQYNLDKQIVRWRAEATLIEVLNNRFKNMLDKELM